MQKEIRHKQKREEMKARSKEIYERKEKRTKQVTGVRFAVGGPVHLYRAVDVRVPTGHQADDLRCNTSRS